MSGQEKYQVVSAGKTLKAKPPGEVIEAAARVFAIPAAQARRLLVKGWVIKDQLTSKQVVDYRARLQQIGLRVEVFPAGKYDNRALVARMQFAQKRRARGAAADTGVGAVETAAAAESGAEPKKGPAKKNTAANEAAQSRPAAPSQSPSPSPSPSQPQSETQADSAAPANTAGGRARSQVQALFADRGVDNGISTGRRLQLIAGTVAGAVVPGLFALLAVFCLYSAGRALWQIPAAVMAGEFSATTVIGCLVSLLLIGFVAALLLWPFFFSDRFDGGAGQGGQPLPKQRAQGLYLLLEVLAEKTGLPGVSRLSLHAGAEVVAGPVDLAALRARQLPLSLGLGAVCSLSGGELLALVARALGSYRTSLHGTTARMVLGNAQRLQKMQWALENERTALAPQGQCPALLRPLHRVLALCGRPLIPLLDRVGALHCRLSGAAARLLECEGDACAAQLLGSDGFVRFAEKWHQLVHAELVVAEINREAAVAGQRLEDVPAAIRWTLDNLDKETRSNIELAMAQTSDVWDSAQAADNERVARVEALALEPMLAREFSVQKLIDELPALCVSLSAQGDAEAVENRKLLCASKESEASQQRVDEYFNRLPLREFLPQAIPAGDEFAAMDLQASIDWLRGKLVDARELDQRRSELLARGAAIQLGAALARLPGKIQPQDYFLSGVTPAAADDSLRDNRTRCAELQQQYRQVFAVFVLRIERAVAAMGGAAQQAAGQQLSRVRDYSALAPRLEKIKRYGDIIALMIERLALDATQRELVLKFHQLAAAELDALFSAVDTSTSLREQGLAGALETRIGRAPAPALPAERQGTLDALRALEIRCKSAGAAVMEQYRIQLAELLGLCLERERALDIRPLRLVASLA
ncbi:hypothetical protein [Microbulbifer sp. SAOS-129_SWC]|uniref:hypothetical protein n=1 Tax=Microbulbifer sp. SAOS-129_SWC TaxID=3145235 RepID=UPI0032165E74